jgi:two-component sensor histidine kinase
VSLLGLQIGSEADPRLKEVLGRAQGRVFAISLIYELLYLQDDLSKIDLSVYLQGLVERLHDLHAMPGLVVREKVASEPIFLDANRAASCGIVVGEFLTNAYKHAFSGRSEGRIDVDIATKDNCIEVSVKDDGEEGDVEAIVSSSSTLGMTLARGIVEGQLHGTMAIRKEGGIVCSLSFPLVAGEGAA